MEKGRCLIKSLAFASGGDWTANHLSGSYHTFAEVNAYLKIHYKGNAPELAPVLVGSRFMWWGLRFAMYANPDKRFLVEIQQHGINHVICCYTGNGKARFYDPQNDYTSRMKRLPKHYRKVKSVWALVHPK